MTNLRDLSCRLRCSLLLKARLQNWHLYFFSGANAELADDDFLMAADVAVDDDMATGMLWDVWVVLWCGWATSMFFLTLPLPLLPHRSMVEIVCLASGGVGFKGCL